jgi:hypothetical protein
LELLRSLDLNQAAPIGFLEAEKLAITLLGSDEHALRLLPLLASLLAIVVFCLAAQQLLRPLAAAVSVAAFALLDPLILYSATVKQYAFDVLAAVAILALALVLEQYRLRRLDIVALTLFGASLVWFSHASVFALGGLAVVLLISCIGSRDWPRTAALLAMSGAWAVSFLVEFFLSRENLTGIVGGFSEESGRLLTPRQDDPSMFIGVTDRLRYLVGLEDTASGDPILGSLPAGVNRGLTVLILIMAVAGFVSLVRRRTRFAVVLATPPVLAALASAMHQYPLVGRTLLFLLPSLALCVGEGAQVLISTTARRGLTVLAAVVVASAVAAIAILPATYAFHPRRGQEMRQALNYLGMRHQRGDTLYVSNQAQYAFAYYHLCSCSTFEPRAAWSFSTTSGGRDQRTAAVESRTPKLIIEANPPSREALSAVTKPLIGRPRVWLMFADALDVDKQRLLDYLDRSGRRVDQFQASGPSGIATSLYLYDLRTAGEE